ncbi:MAG: translation elongation factor 4 [Elusimicrobiaceae bacterium]|nr:translation elongation factor 4 [Elusimicrobiaceae bacterium]
MKTRNFSIVAHIDHGKSTLADRLLEETGTIPHRKMREQILDGMDLERERGITIKAKAVRMGYTDRHGERYQLNLIDTPGHVDFSYEVARSLRACEGVLLLVDCTQGVEAQTVAHAHLAMQLGLKIIPVLNKVDLAQGDADSCEEQLWELMREPIQAERVSAKTGEGVAGLLERIVADVPDPGQHVEAPLRALIVDSFYDSFRGVIVYVRIIDGSLRTGMTVRQYASGFSSKVEEVGYMLPGLTRCDELKAGEVGYLIAGVKDIHMIKVGDTVMDTDRPARAPLPGYREAKPVVFASIFPISSSDYQPLKMAIEKLNLSDSAFHFTTENSKALGFGFRLGFMGLLHMEIVKERLEREFGIPLIVTSPNVVYRVKMRTKTTHIEGALGTGKDDYLTIDNPANFPYYGDVEEVLEPYVTVTIVTPIAYMENIMLLLKDKRGIYGSLEHMGNSRVIVKFDMPLGEMVMDFYDKLKSVSKGYASFDYEMAGEKPSDIVVMEVLIHGEPVDALSVMTHKDKAEYQGRLLCLKLKELIPRHQFEIALQARVRGKIVARETLGALRKDVIAKCYGGDITRKRKLLEKQKEGKKKMKQLGRVEMPQEAFVAMLKISREN